MMTMKRIPSEPPEQRYGTQKSMRIRSLSNGGRSYTVNNPLQVQIPPPHLHQTSSLYHQPIHLHHLSTTNVDGLVQTASSAHNSLIHHHPQQVPHHHDQSQAPITTNTPSLINGGESFAQFITNEQDVKWSRQDQICTPCNCICYFIAFLLLLTALMSGIYYGLNFFDGKHLRERVFKAQFVVRNQDYLSSELENSESNEFHEFSEMMKKRINHLFQQSIISNSYVKTEIIALERKRNSPSEVIIHLNIHVAANKPNVEASDIYLILAEEIINNRLKVFDNLMVDHASIDVQERKWMPRERISSASSSSSLTNPWTYKSVFPGMLEGLRTEPTPAPRKCGRIDLAYCQFLSYNQTSYPNFFNHWNVSSLEDEFIQYKELIDSECYSLSKEFLCNLLQPECIADEMILPCQDFCLEFYNACKRWLPDKLARKISCYTFPSKDPNDLTNIKTIQSRAKKCREKPNCATMLRLQMQHHKICDGIFDCQDYSDEMNCEYCKELFNTNSRNEQQQFHCGDRQCIWLNMTCDNIKDCHNGADESNCLKLSSLSFVDQSRNVNSDKWWWWTNSGRHDNNNQENNKNKIPLFTMAHIPNEGYLEAIWKGKPSFVCSDHSTTTTATSGTNIGSTNNYSSFDHLPNTYYDNQTPILGHKICTENHFEKLIQIESKPAIVGPIGGGSNGQSFTRFVPGTTLPSPYPTQCKNKQVYYMECSIAKCGINHIPADTLSNNNNNNIVGTASGSSSNWLLPPKKSYPGYWPWYVKININGHYLCDGTLISLDTVLAQTTCFVNQRSLINNNHNLTVTLGSVRLSHDNSEAQEYSVWSIKNHQLGDGANNNNNNDNNNNDIDKLTILKLDRAIKTTNIMRPICQHGQQITWTSTHKCVLLNLNYELDILQYRPVRIVNIEFCKQLEKEIQRNYFSTTTNNTNNIKSIEATKSSSSSWPSSTLSPERASTLAAGGLTTTTEQQELKNKEAHWTQHWVPTANYNNKLCVQHYDDDHNNNNNNNNEQQLFNLYDDTLIHHGSRANDNNNSKGRTSTSNNNMMGSFITSSSSSSIFLGRHLYCSSKNQWNILAIEYRTITANTYRLIQQQQQEYPNYNNNKKTTTTYRQYGSTGSGVIYDDDDDAIIINTSTSTTTTNRKTSTNDKNLILFQIIPRI